jgi:hypothetical protein
MYELKAVNCCAALRVILDSGPDGGACPPGAGPCRGFVGECGDLTQQFANVPVLPDYPLGLSSFVCTAFPDDARFVDTFLVALLSFAATIPVAFFCLSMFDFANDNEPRDVMLKWRVAWPMLVWGWAAHHKWHFAEEPHVARFPRWFIRLREEPPAITLWNLGRCAVAAICCRPPPWHEEEAAAEEGEAEEVEQVVEDDTRFRRCAMLVGLVAIYVCWACFSWFIFTYGMLIYKGLGSGAEQGFTRSFGVSFGLNQASEMRDVVTAAAKAVLLAAILDRLLLTPHEVWMETALDLISVQAVILEQKLGLAGRVRTHYQFTKRFATE